MIKLEHIYRYPVKSLSPELLDTIDLSPGDGLPGDRRYALAPGSTALDGATTQWMAKNNFMVLVKHEKLAALETSFDNLTKTLTVLRGGKQVARGNLEDPIGRTMIESFFTAYMGDQSRGQIKVAKAIDGHSLEDQSSRSVSIINLATIRDMERVQGSAIDPLRFRGNLYIDTGEPWSEFDWLGKDISVGDVTVSVRERTGRCGATNVNPKTAERDMNLLKTLMMGFSHTDCGVFVDVKTAGKISGGDTISS
jgi:uncharacterized protein YcbX